MFSSPTPGQVGVLEIAGLDLIAHDVGEDTEPGHHEVGGHYGQPVQAVGDVDRVGDKDHENDDKGVVDQRAQIGQGLFVEGDVELGGLVHRQGREIGEDQPGKGQGE